jgi:hypothetical protein
MIGLIVTFAFAFVNYPFLFGCRVADIRLSLRVGSNVWVAPARYIHFIATIELN